MAYNDEQHAMSSTNSDEFQRSAFLTRTPAHLSLKDSVKALGVRSVKSLGTLVGLSGNEGESLALWKETWIKKVQSGYTGMSFKVHTDEINNGPPEEQIEDTLTQLNRIGSCITSSSVVKDEEDTSFLEQFHQKLVQPAVLLGEEELAALLSKIQGTNESTGGLQAEDLDQDAVDTFSLFNTEAVQKSPFQSCTDINQLDKEERETCTDIDNKMVDVETTAIGPEQVDIDLKKSVASDSSLDKRYVYGREALLHYKLFIELEKRSHKEKRREKKKQTIEKLKGHLQMLDQLVEVGKEFFHKPSGKAAKEWNELQKDVSQKCAQEFALQNQLGNLPVYYPYFTIIIIITQMISFVTICVLGGLTTIGFEPQYELQKNIKTFLGTETVHNLVLPNPWIGPANDQFIGLGAMFSPCMREDYWLNLQTVQRNYSHEEPLGCCEISSRNTAGTTTEDECYSLTNGVGIWRESNVCSQRVSGNNSVEHNMKPCCFGIKGKCHLLSHHHCVFLNGIYHIKGSEHCSQVNCLSKTCGMGGLHTETDRPWLAVSPNQWWRLLLSLIYNQGVIQLILVCIGHLLLTRNIEPIAGWLRVAILYILSGICGLTTLGYLCCTMWWHVLVSRALWFVISNQSLMIRHVKLQQAGAIFSPYEPHFGTIGSLFGMMGLTLVEFLQSWRLVRQPYRELAKLLAIVLICFLCGTLPFISIYQLFFSLLAGILTSVIILPYVTFGHWNEGCRKILVGVCIPLQIFLLFILMFIFYRVQTVHNNCDSCQWLECIPYTEKFCLTD